MSEVVTASDLELRVTYARLQLYLMLSICSMAQMAQGDWVETIY